MGTGLSMIIRAEQLATFASAARSRFEEKLIDFLRGSFPNRSARLGEAGLRETVQFGIGQAGAYGIVRQCDVAKYISIMFMFGPHFDSELSSGPLYEVLRDPRLEGSSARSDALHVAALSALRMRTMRSGMKPVW